MTTSVPLRAVGQTGLQLPPLGFGAFKIGRNQGIKYPTPYDLPDLDTVRTLLEGIRALGCHYFDTAPAYGLSEDRLGTLLPADNPSEDPAVVISTKVGETFQDGHSTYDFSRAAVERSLHSSRERLQRDVLDLVCIHAHQDDVSILHETDVVAVLQEWRERGTIRAIGFSGKTPAAAIDALEWADALMIEYHLRDTSHATVLDLALARGVAVLVKKALASGTLPAEAALRFVLAHPAVTSVVVGGLSLSNFQANWNLALGSREPAMARSRTTPDSRA